MLRFTTETGRVYDVDLENGFWLRHAKPGGYQGGWERLWEFKAGKADGPWGLPHEYPDQWEDDRAPVVGEHLYVGALNVWHASSLIVSIEELPSPFDD